MNETKTATQKRNARKRAATKRQRVDSAALEVAQEANHAGEWSLEYHRISVRLRSCDTALQYAPGPGLDGEGDRHAIWKQCSQTQLIYDCPFALGGLQRPIYWLDVAEGIGYNSFDFVVTDSVSETVSSVKAALECIADCVKEGEPYAVVLVDGDGKEVKRWLGTISLVNVGAADVLAAVDQVG